MTTVSNERLTAVGTTLNFLASVIKSGEPWTAACQHAFDKAHAALRAQGGVEVGAWAVPAAEWLEEAAKYFERRPTDGEDAAFWANFTNKQFCEGLASRLRALSASEASPTGAARIAAMSDEELAADRSAENPNVGRVKALPAPVSEHPDDLAVDRFAAAMKAKLAKKREEGRGGWANRDECSTAFLSGLLREHVEKGDPLDVGNLAMMLHQRGDAIAPAPVSDTPFGHEYGEGMKVDDLIAALAAKEGQ